MGIQCKSFWANISILRFKVLAAQSKDDLVQLGYSQFTIEDFYDTVSLKIIIIIFFNWFKTY